MVIQWRNLVWRDCSDYVKFICHVGKYTISIIHLSRALIKYKTKLNIYYMLINYLTLLFTFRLYQKSVQRPPESGWRRWNDIDWLPAIECPDRYNMAFLPAHSRTTTSNHALVEALAAACHARSVSAGRGCEITDHRTIWGQAHYLLCEGRDNIKCRHSEVRLDTYDKFRVLIKFTSILLFLLAKCERNRNVGVNTFQLARPLKAYACPFTLPVEYLNVS